MEGGWRQESASFARAFASAFIFGIPLLFTMEMWWIGQYAERWKILTFVAAALATNLGLSYAAGFRSQRGIGSPGEHLDQAVDAFAVGVIGGAAVLLALNQIGPQSSLDAALGKVVLQAIPLGIGASVANQVFDKSDGKGQPTETQPHEGGWLRLAADLGATAIGGIFICASIAPTEEVTLLASNLSVGHLLATIGLSLGIGQITVLATGLRAHRSRHPTHHPFALVVLAYAVSLLVALVSLLLFDAISFDDPLHAIIRRVVVLAVPTAIGGAAGRLVI